MLLTASPRVESFVLRFVNEVHENGAPKWHAVIAHVQSNEDKTFTNFADAVAFIARYVQIGDFVFNMTQDQKPKTDDVGYPSSLSSQSGE